MKKLFVLTLVVMLGLTGLAAANEATVEQVGDDNVATVTQARTII